MQVAFDFCVMAAEASVVATPQKRGGADDANFPDPGQVVLASGVEASPSSSCVEATPEKSPRGETEEDEDGDLVLTWLAKRFAKPKQSKDAAESQQTLLNYEAFVRIIMHLEKHPSKARDAWALMTSRSMSSPAKSNAEASNMWNPEYRAVWRLPIYWRATFLAKRRPDIFTKEYLQKMEAENPLNVTRIFEFETNLDPNDALPTPMLHKDVCHETCKERADLCGSRLSNTKASAFPDTGKIVFGPSFGAYILKFKEGEEGALDTVTHTGTAVVGVIPPVINITRNYFVVMNNHSDKHAVLIYKHDEKIRHHLSSFFASGVGPHSTDTGVKSKNLKTMAEAVEKRLNALKLQQEAMQLVADKRLFDDNQQEKRTRALDAARTVVKENKKAKAVADRVAL